MICATCEKSGARFHINVGERYTGVSVCSGECLQNIPAEYGQILDDAGEDD